MLADTYNREVAEFFGTKPLSDIEVVLFNSQKEIIDFYNKNSKDNIDAPAYLVGFSPENYIFIIGPDGMPPDRDAGPIRFQKVLKHEIVHKYIKPISNQRTPSWLIEGTCLCIAKQVNKEIANENITIGLLNDLSYTKDGRKYQVGYNMVKRIIDGFGKEKLFELLAMSSRDQLNAELQNMFPWLLEKSEIDRTS